MKKYDKDYENNKSEFIITLFNFTHILKACLENRMKRRMISRKKEKNIQSTYEEIIDRKFLIKDVTLRKMIPENSHQIDWKILLICAM